MGGLSANGVRPRSSPLLFCRDLYRDLYRGTMVFRLHDHSNAQVAYDRSCRRDNKRLTFLDSD